MRSPHCPSWRAWTLPILTAVRVRSARSVPCPRACGSACPGPASVNSLATPIARTPTKQPSAAFYEIAELRALCERAFGAIDALALPTIPRAYAVAEVLADPFELNRKLGTYTNFVNLFDLCALAVPAAMLPDGVPFGITLMGRAGDDALIASIARRFHADTALPLGATGVAQPPLVWRI